MILRSFSMTTTVMSDDISRLVFDPNTFTGYRKIHKTPSCGSDRSGLFKRAGSDHWTSSGFDLQGTITRLFADNLGTSNAHTLRPVQIL